jgi:hypothetical protein
LLTAAATLLHRYVFDRAAVEEAEMRLVSQHELGCWAEQMLLSPEARRLSVHVRKGTGAAPSREEDEPPPPGAVRLAGPSELKATAEFRPPHESPLPPVVAPATGTEELA